VERLTNNNSQSVRTWTDNKVHEMILEGLFIMKLYQMDKQPSLLFGSTEKAA